MKKLYEILMTALLIAIAYMAIISLTARLVPEYEPVPINHQVLITEAKLTDTGYLYRIDGVWHTDTVKRYVGDYFVIFEYE